jgi:hypothetical protein
MALYDTVWYTNSVGYAAVTVRPQNTAVAAGVLRRQFTAPAVGSERVFVCIVAGTTANVTDATWVLTRGAKTVDGTATWQEVTGASAVNGDLANTVTWTQAKAIGVPTLGAIIQRNNQASYWICSTAGTMGASEPAWPNDTAGTNQADGTTTWTCLGVVGNFTGGQAPHARLANACTSTWMVAGNTVYVGHNHAESQATAISISPLNSTTTVGRIICHNAAGSYPPTSVTTGATISTTAAVNLSFIPANGGFYIYGISFLAGVGASSGSSNIVLSPTNAYYYFDNCIFKIANTSSSVLTVQVNSAANAGVIVWNNCTVSFGHVNHYIDVGTSIFVWQNTGQVLVSGSAVPLVLLGASTNARLSNVILEAVDFSQITTTLTGQTAVSMGNWLIKDCKFNATTALAIGSSFGQTIQTVRCDSAATGYKSTRYQYEGTETTETSITRVGGSVDPTGQAQSRKIVTSANALWPRPFRAEPYAVWNSVAGANVTVTVYGTINAGAVPNNDDIWMTVVYLGSSLTPAGSFARTNKANILAVGTPLPSDASVWNGGGSGAGWSPFKLTVTLSSPQPGMAGYIHARIRAAKPTTTFYIDPQVVLS